MLILLKHRFSFPLFTHLNRHLKSVYNFEVPSKERIGMIFERILFLLEVNIVFTVNRSLWITDDCFQFPIMTFPFLHSQHNFKRSSFRTFFRNIFGLWHRGYLMIRKTTLMSVNCIELLSFRCCLRGLFLVRQLTLQGG